MSQNHQKSVATTNTKSSAVSPKTSIASTTAKVVAVKGSTKDTGRVHIGAGMMRF